MKEFLLVLLGALISCGTTWLLDFLRSRREEKCYYKRKKEEAYLAMQDFIVEYFTYWNDIKKGIINNNIIIKYNSIRSKAHVYGKKQIVDYFYDLANDMLASKNKETYNERNNNLIDMIQKDLKIEDN